jgi:hypothetical protein
VSDSRRATFGGHVRQPPSHPRSNRTGARPPMLKHT